MDLERADLLEGLSSTEHPPQAEARPREADVLLAAMRGLAAARDLPDVMALVRRAARDLTQADGVTFVLREGPMVHYADEEAIGPLWKGRRFPATACISGWAMIHRESVVIEDIYADARIPHDAYRPTFVQSLAMVPIRAEDPVGAVGAYWAHPHEATPRQVALLEALADAAGVALVNVDLIAGLERSVRIRDEFIALASHELRTPVTAVRLRVEALGRGERVPSADDLDRLRGVLSRLEDVVAGLGEFSRASREGIRLVRGAVDLVEVTRRAAESVRGRARTDATGTTVGVRAPEQVIGEWDAVRLSQAVTHLLENAVKFGRGAPVEVEVTDGPGEATVAVRDHGPGIAAADQERVFARYERATTSMSHGGLGLGLWLARAVAEAHGGSVSVESAPGLGATFTLRIPKRLPTES